MATTPTSPIVNKLQSSVRNQLIGGHHQSKLNLRRFDFSSTPVRIELRPILTSSQTAIVSDLDVSYSKLSWETLSELCQCLPHLLSLKAVECHLPDTQSAMIPWPTGLVSLDLSRNKLQNLPGGVGNLMKLETINLSGNYLLCVDQELLQLPRLREVSLVNNHNTLENIPKEICRKGVAAMRQHLNVTPLPIPPEQSLTNDQRPPFPPAAVVPASSHIRSRAHRKLNLPSDSTDSDYCSVVSLPLSSSSCSTLSDQSLSSSPTPSPSPMSYTSFSCPPGYTKDYQSNYCQILLPQSTSPDVKITINVIQDDSFSPSLLPHELLATPIVRVEPHGLLFPTDQPALVVLPLCSQPQALLQCTPLCSNTSHFEPPHWKRLASSQCEVYDDCVVISTTHFSLFAVASFLDYPSVEQFISPQVGGLLKTEHLPGFQLVVPPNSTQEAELFKATVFYASEPYHYDEEMALGSACIALEPHGLNMCKHVTISLPIPDSQAILGAFPNAQLKLFVTPTADQLAWQHLADAPIELIGDLAKFQVNHFSLFKFVWNIPSETLRKIRSGASYVYRYMRTQSLSVRCQVLMTPPLPSDLSFGLLVAVFKFGDPLKEVANYKWILADSGDKKVFLKTGDVQVNLQGLKFKPLTQLEESDMSRDIPVPFTGEDFCRRAEFALQLEDLTLPIPDWQLLGKLTITQWDGTQCMEMNLCKVVHKYQCACNLD